MGGRPVTALCMAVVPFGMDDKMEEELFQMMAGASEVGQEVFGCEASHTNHICGSYEHLSPLGR